MAEPLVVGTRNLAIEADLVELKYSALGQAILHKGQLPDYLQEAAPSLQRLLERV